MNFIVSFICR